MILKQSRCLSRSVQRSMDRSSGRIRARTMIVGPESHLHRRPRTKFPVFENCSRCCDEALRPSTALRGSSKDSVSCGMSEDTAKTTPSRLTLTDSAHDW
ncbi:hypothetical protein KM043_008599 [Ampulex compressa]|nr:hypothetical protein KM043_008599 [Ampulex compressa]